MSARTLEADYLVIGSGAAGMAFADSLITETDDQIVMVDRRVAPGGHRNDAYAFVRLHQPSVYYGVNSIVRVCMTKRRKSLRQDVLKSGIGSEE